MQFMQYEIGGQAKAVRNKNGRAGHYLQHGVTVTITEMHRKGYGENLIYEFEVLAYGRDFLPNDRRFLQPDRVFDQYIHSSEIMPVTFMPGSFERIHNTNDLPEI